MSAALNTKIATLSLEGKKDAEIIQELGLDLEDLTKMKKSKGFKKARIALSDRLLDDCGNRLVTIANHGLNKIAEAVSGPLSNLSGEPGSGLERKVCDPVFLRELRIATVALLSLAQDHASSRSESSVRIGKIMEKMIDDVLKGDDPKPNDSEEKLSEVAGDLEGLLEAVDLDE